MAAEPTVSGWLRPRLRIVGTATLVGLVVGPVLLAALAMYGGDPAFGARKAFAVGALVLGFGVIGWSGSIFAGRGIEGMQRHLDTGSDWSQEDSRRAMGRIAGFGLGVMVSTAVVETVL